MNSLINNSKTIGSFLKRLRKENGETQAGIAFKVGCNQATLSKIERGVADISLGLLRSILSLYQLKQKEKIELMDIILSGDVKTKEPKITPKMVFSQFLKLPRNIREKITTQVVANMDKK